MNGIVDPVGYEYLRIYLSEIKNNDNTNLLVHATDDMGNRFRVFITYPYHNRNIIRCVTFINRSRESQDAVEGTDTQFLQLSKENIYHSFEIIDYNTGGTSRFVLDRRARQTSIPRATQQVVQRRPRNQFGNRRRM
jgi:hypothetical protein